jgi:glycosyltransferase involved in cell wall biosynthesis
MNRKSLDFLIPMFPFSPFYNYSILVINQTSATNILVSEYLNIKVINSFETGLSKSRNLALQNATGKILLLADDDEVFKNDFDIAIVDSYNKNPKATVISFALEKPDGSLFKKYAPTRKLLVKQTDFFSVLSIEISINKALFDKLNVTFDENFGLGSCFEMGEEALFLCDIKNKKQKLVFESKVIATHPFLSTNDRLDFLKRYYIQGAFLTRISKKKFYPRLFQKLFFDIKQNKIKYHEISRAIKSAQKGKKDFYTKQ